MIVDVVNHRQRAPGRPALNQSFLGKSCTPLATPNDLQMLIAPDRVLL
jgi:hypothetical protein